MKKCSACQVTKPLSAFAKNRRNPDGFQAYCQPCATARVRAYRAANPERAKASRSAWRERNRDRESIYRLARHGLTVEIVEAALVTQGFHCAVCRKADLRETRVCADHDHACCPGRYGCDKCFRGLLCSNCNTGIGLLGEDPETLANAIQYLHAKA